jgi:serine/tyrosine/threonine adenylyltransferase
MSISTIGVNPPATSAIAEPASIDARVPRMAASFAQLGERYYSLIDPDGLPKPHLVALNPQVSTLLDLDAAHLRDESGVNMLSGNTLWPGSEPLASVYSGHQFGVWAGQLGDGRALLLGDLPGIDGLRYELQLKGAGPTPYSRRADGRAVLRSSIREYLASIAMAGLGIPTTHALSLTASDLPVIRETVETAAVVCRVAPSFLRFGHFEHFHHQQQPEALRVLAEHLIAAHYPQCEGPERYAQLLATIIKRTAELIARWQGVGFCHGVMNTDNMSVLGLTIDYGPFGFLDVYDPAHICNHSDYQGRYAYQMQPRIGYWNCMCLAQCFVDLIGSVEQTQAILQAYPDHFTRAVNSVWMAKIGLQTQGATDLDAQDVAMAQSLLDLMKASRADFTVTFRLLNETLAQLASSASTAHAPSVIRDMFLDRAGFDQWYSGWIARLGSDRSAALKRMQAANPRLILRNFMAQEAIEKAQKGDFTEVNRLQDLLQDPYAAPKALPQDLALPPDWAQGLELSCSS